MAVHPWTAGGAEAWGGVVGTTIWWGWLFQGNVARGALDSRLRGNDVEVRRLVSGAEA